MSMRNRIFAFVVAALLALSLLPTAAMAVSDTGWYTGGGHAGDLADPYLIVSGDELAGLAELVNAGNDFAGKVVKIANGATVDLSAYPNWIPIGTPAHPFRGTFDGNSVAMTGLTINDSYELGPGETRCVGLFGNIGSGGTVTRLILSGINVSVTHTYSGFLSGRNSFVGGIAGANEGTVSHCTVTGTIAVSGIEVKVGGVAGTNGSDSGTSANTFGTIEYCSADCDIAATSCYQLLHLGGIAGSSSTATGVIDHCTSAGTLTAYGAQKDDGTYACTPSVGGVAGYLGLASVTNCTSSANVTAEEYFRYVYAGGLAGYAGSSSIRNCVSSGSVTGKGGDNPNYTYEQVSVGGFVGLFTYTSALSELVDCYSTGNATAQVKAIDKQGYAFAGGFAGYVRKFGDGICTITRCYATGDATATALSDGRSYSGGFAGYLQYTTVEQCFSAGNSSSVAGGSARSGGFAATVVDATVVNAYAVGSAYSNCVTQERAGGFAGMIAYTTSFLQCYSAGLPSVAHTGGTDSIVGSFVGAAADTFTFTDCYFDSDTTGALNAAGSGTVSGITGASRAAMTDDGTLSADLSGLNASGHWMKRANIAAELYYPELTALGTAGGVVQTASKSSVTVSQTLYEVTVVSGSGSGSYESGAVIDITANAAPSGKVFDKWTSSGGGSFGDAASASTTFTVPARNVTVTATYQSASGSSGSSSRPTITVVETPDNLSGNISVTPVGDAFDRSVEVRLTEDSVTEQQVRNALSGSGISHQAALVYPLDISLYLRGTDTKIQPKEGTSVRITCPIPNELLAYQDKLAVVCIVNGELQVLEANVVRKGNVWYVQFEASHFSPYAFVVDEAGMLTEGLTLPTEQVVNPPKTGGDLGIGVALFYSAIGAAALLLKKRA